mmetsp:Transcript_61972/g.164356  ORF Transcript_61972/g.164356 Transcript_61972/m.164356 type:complete len:356 (+) Transcript_61972:3-1070(+)
MTVVPRTITRQDGSVHHGWNEDYGILFLDNPLGTGFSFTDSLARMATNQSTVGADLYAALQQFFQLFPEHRSRDFYVTGESYAGKYVPACAYTIHTRNVQAPAAQQINLRGISIGDGAFDPPNQLSSGFGALLYNLGMATEAERRHFEEYEKNITTRLEAGDPVGAFRAFDEMLNGDETAAPTYYANVTGMGSNYFNFAQGPNGSSLTRNYFIDWLGTAAGRAAMNVGRRAYAAANGTVETQLLGDWMVGVTDMLVPLLQNYKVLIYSGQNDIILGPPLTEKALRSASLAKWDGQPAFVQTPKKPWTIGADLAGYSRVVGNFTYAVVRGAGHMVPTDQPTRALDLITRFVDGTPF